MTRLIVALVSCLLSLPALAFAQHEAHGAMPPDAIGSASVKFETSCVPAVRDDFNKGVALLHSFWFPEAIKAFEAILAADGQCAMAHWGIALSQWGNPFAGIKPARTVELTKASIEKAAATGSPTPRERAYIAAVAQLVTAADPGSHGARIGAYEAAMEKLSREYPADTEARIFYALAVNQTAPPTDKTYAKNLKAAGILEPLFAQMPTHPGLAHYIIHAYDAPPLAEKALVAARKYASLAPAIPHALHMPSHTFTRVGSWQESIDTNRRSAEAARKSNGAGEELHALDYQTYAYLQIAQDTAAKAVLDRANEAARAATGPANSFAIAAIPARYALERGHWADAAALTPSPANTPYTEAITHFARAVGAARSGNSGGGHRRHRAPGRAARQDQGAQGRVLDRTDRDSTPRRAGVADLRDGQQGRRPRAAERGGGRRGSDRQVGGVARTAGAGARAPGLHAARRRQGEGGARRLRSDDEEGAESVPRHLWSGARRRDRWRPREGDGALQDVARGGEGGGHPAARSCSTRET